MADGTCKQYPSSPRTCTQEILIPPTTPSTAPAYGQFCILLVLLGDSTPLAKWIHRKTRNHPLHTPASDAIQLTQNPPDSTVSSGIWLNVELSVGILSVSLPLMRALVSRAIPSQIRTRFTKSHTGTHRLQDIKGLNGGAQAPHSKDLSEAESTRDRVNDSRRAGTTLGRI
ncbi:MAG: hypothetical protein Q9192_008286 [Flavoplaca navasiana]